MSAALEIWCVTPSSSGGWGPITALARLAGRLPALWGDAAANTSVLAQHGLTHQGWFDLVVGEDNQAAVRRELDQAKAVLTARSLARSRPQCAAANLVPDQAWIDPSLMDLRADVARITDAPAQHELDEVRDLTASLGQDDVR